MLYVLCSIFFPMTTDRIIVTAIGVLASAWVLWYFLAPPKPR